MPGLGSFGQGAFSSGMWRAVARHKIPADGLYDAQNALLDDDGVVYRRGPASRLSSPAVTGNRALIGLWDMEFVGGRRTFGMCSDRLVVLNGSTPVEFSGLTAPASGIGLAAKVGDIAFVPGGSGSTPGGFLYGGALGGGVGGITVTATPGSATVTTTGIAGNSFAGFTAGLLFYSPGVSKRVYVVKSIESNTSLTLSESYGADETAVTSGFFDPVYIVSAPPLLGGLGSKPYSHVGPQVAAVANKLWTTDTTLHRVYQSRGPDADTGRPRPQDFDDVTTYHEFSSQITALVGLRDRLFVFTQDGLYVISNCALDIVDGLGNPQQRIERITDEVLVRSAAGVTLGHDVIVAAGRDGCYLIDSLGTVETLSRSIAPYWQAATQAGATPGMPTVYRKHVFVPLNGEVLVCRLDRPRKSPVGTVYPWTRFSGYLGGCKAFAVKDPTGSTKLIAGSSDGYVLDATGIFSTGTAEGDSSVHQMTLETGETDLDGETFVQDVEADYSLAGTGATVGVSVARGEQASAGAAPTYTALSGSAPENYTTQKPYVFAVGKACRRVSFKFTTAGSAVAEAKVLGWRARFRPRGRRR